VLERSFWARLRAGGTYLETAARSGLAAVLLCKIWTKLKWGEGLLELKSKVRGVWEARRETSECQSEAY
jgi:F420-0:gamma-glutamyl ligase-like protein